MLLSSHLLDEVERVADTIVMIHQGEMVLTERMDQIRARRHRLVLTFADPMTEAPNLPGTLNTSGGPHEWVCCCEAPLEELEQRAIQMGARIAESSSLSLDDIFVARVRG